MARTRIQSPGMMRGCFPPSRTRNRSGVRAGESCPMRNRSRVTRLAPGRTSTPTTRPATFVGPRRWSSTGVWTATVRHWAGRRSQGRGRPRPKPPPKARRVGVPASQRRWRRPFPTGRVRSAAPLEGRNKSRCLGPEKPEAKAPIAPARAQGRLLPRASQRDGWRHLTSHETAFFLSHLGRRDRLLLQVLRDCAKPGQSHCPRGATSRL